MTGLLFFSPPLVFSDSLLEVLTLVALLSVLGSTVTVARRYWRSTECHIAGCKKHQWKKVPGTDHVVCKPHLKKITGRGEPSHEQVLEDHKAARHTAARSL